MRYNIGMLIFVILVALALRLFGINWDGGYHLHPDERMLIMVAQRITFFSHLDPQFFNYGSLPIYLLSGITQAADALFHTHLATYEGQLYVGRILSALFDTGSVLLVYLIAQRLWKNQQVALWGSLVYATAVFPIQNSHFFVVDPMLTFFFITLLHQLIIYIQELKPSWVRISVIALICAAAITTKFTGILLIPIAGIVIIYKQYIDKKIVEIVPRILFFGSCILGFSFVFMPYAFLSYHDFIRDISLQLQMSSNAYIFPYTLQYVATMPYLYPLQQLFLWGFGPIYTILALIGIWLTIKHKKQVIILVFIIVYFLLIGRSAVKFMRYMLPLYPMLALYAGYTVAKLGLWGKVLFIISLLWTLSFMTIYAVPNTRVTASNWILSAIPAGSTIAVEHWDDRLPLYGSQRYTIKELPLYDRPDNAQKWKRIDGMLELSDYLVIASNRLYTPLQKLGDCSRYSVCYPRAAAYYRKLFAQKQGFTLVKTFRMSPLGINDESADESFTVYDHPTIFIFKKN